MECTYCSDEAKGLDKDMKPVCGDVANCGVIEIVEVDTTSVSTIHQASHTMKQLTTDQIKQVEAHHNAIVTAQDAANAEIERLNAAIDAFNAFRTDLHDNMQAHFDGKPEKWQESDAGAAYSEWMEKYEEEIDLVEEIDVCEASGLAPDDMCPESPGDIE